MKNLKSRFSVNAAGLSQLFPLLVYFLIVFMGSFLLFTLEPLYAKMILPWFGGSSSVWALCLFFFQGALLVGYGYADFSARKMSPKNQTFIHVGLLLLSLFFIPITLAAHWRPHPGSDPAWSILWLLTATIGLPFALLSSTSPLVQAWYARSRPNGKPYFLFAVSNSASLLALVAFPFLFEPNFSTGRMAVGWSCSYVFFAALCSLLAWRCRESGDSPKDESSGDPPIPLGKALMWIGLSACGSMLLLSITNQITQNTAPVPLLWILPLAVYLLSFILVFSREGLYPGKWPAYGVPAVMAILAYFLGDFGRLKTLPVAVLVFCAGLFIGCFFCHGELARQKPGQKHLTGYYLMISLGGALGACFVGMAAPRIFPAVYEFPIALWLTSAMVLWVLWKDGLFARVFCVLFLVGLGGALFHRAAQDRMNSIMMMRNFYATLKVVPENDGDCLSLYNGVIRHGVQFTDDALAMEPTSYYARNSGIGLALDEGFQGLKRVGVIGLGTGTLAAYGHTGDVFRFYEINPQDIMIAERYFTFLGKSPARVEIVMGDARLSLEAEKPQGYDVLAVDAFTGDSIPVHLLTKEAFAIYMRHLKPEGILAVHVSNRYLDLAPVVRRIADDAGYPSVCVESTDDLKALVLASKWVLVTRNRIFLENPRVKALTKEVPDIQGLRLWTDDYNSLFSVFRN